MSELAALREELTVLRAYDAAHRAQIAELISQIARLNDRVAELLAVAQRKARKPTVERPASPPPTLSPEAKLAFEKRPKPPEKPAAKPKEKRRSKPTGRKALPAHLEAETRDLRPDACDHCGSAALEAVETLTEEKLHLVKEHLRRRVVKRTTCRCQSCGGRTTPRSLPAPYARSKVTCEWLAGFIHQKFAMLVPLDRIRRDLEERGVKIAMSTMVSFVERAADILAPIDGYHWQQLLAAKWMVTDGTGLKVLVPGLGAAHNGYIELYRNQETAVFQYEPSKDGDRLVAKLSPFAGKLTADAEHRMNGVFASGRVTEGGCNAHGRRKFEDAEATQPVLAAEGGGFIGAMYGAENEAQRLGLTGDALRAHRQNCIRPITTDFEVWWKTVLPTLLPSEPLAVAIQYYVRHKDALFRFIDDPDFPIDNSATEREFQNVAKLRLAMLFAGSTEGAHRACVLLGIVATCRAVGVSSAAYLTWAFDRLGTHRDLFDLPIAELTPAAFKKTLAS